MAEDLAKKLNDCPSKGYVIAPAGYGKTHLIALAVKESEKRQLILTHTFAGVASIKNKLAALGVTSSKYQVDTIASWTLRLCLAYPRRSGWEIENPHNKQWSKLYECCTKLINRNFMRDVLVATYSGVYVDEYQDCSELQHSLVCSLADIMPCRVLGDPMQAIFDFADMPVDWNKSIYPYFVCLGHLDTPWRWKSCNNPELGEWLKTARSKLDRGEKIDLFEHSPQGLVRIYGDMKDLDSRQRNALFKQLNHDESVIALFGGDQKSKNKAHQLARSMGGRFSSIEEVEGKSLHSVVKKIAGAEDAKTSFLAVIAFSKSCFTGMSGVLTAGTVRGDITKKTKSTKYPLLLEVANEYLQNPNSWNLYSFLVALKGNERISVYRRDLFNRFLNVLKTHIDGGGETLVDAANVYQFEMRHSGRPINHKKLIGTTLLVKGLEYDHAVILNADELDVKELYVAMTRGSKSLTIIGSSRYLPAK